MHQKYIIVKLKIRRDDRKIKYSSYAFKIRKGRKMSIESGILQFEIPMNFYLIKSCILFINETNTLLLFYLWGISSPPSTAPFNAPKTFAPVVVRARPTSRKQRNGRFSPSTGSFSNSPPVTSVVPLYILSSLCFCNVRRAKSKPVQ